MMKPPAVKARARDFSTYEKTAKKEKGGVMAPETETELREFFWRQMNSLTHPPTPEEFHWIMVSRLYRERPQLAAAVIAEKFEGIFKEQAKGVVDSWINRG